MRVMSTAVFEIRTEAQGLFQPLRHVREDRNPRRAAGLVARVHTYVGENRADDDAAAPLLREVLQVGGYLGDVEFGVAWNLDTTLPAFIN